MSRLPSSDVPPDALLNSPIPFNPLSLPKVLVVDDDPLSLELLSQYLQAAGYPVVQARDGQEAIELLKNGGASIVVSDWIMPGMDGPELCRMIRAHEEIGFVYFIMLTIHSDKSRLMEAFQSGVDDFASKPFHEGELMARVRAGMRVVYLQEQLAHYNLQTQRANAELALANEKLQHASNTDELTGLPNRRCLLNRLTMHWTMAHQHQTPLSCLLIDLDRFKHVNDTFGHEVGDQVLKTFAQVMRRVCGPGDELARLGGEEFAVLVVNQSSPQAEHLAQRLRQQMAVQSFAVNGQRFQVTVSIGIAEVGRTMINSQMLLKAADEAMYQAKAAGRNCIRLASGDEVPGDFDPPDSQRLR